MSKRRHLTDPPGVDAISGPDPQNFYAQKYQNYKNALNNLKYHSNKLHKAYDDEDKYRKLYYDKAKELYPTNYYYLTDNQRKQISKLIPEYATAALNREYEQYNFDEAKRNYYKKARILGQATINKYRNTRYDVLNATNWGGEDYLAGLGVRESRGAQEVADYFNSYANSPGIDRIIKNQGKQVSWIKRYDYTKSARDLRNNLKTYPMSKAGSFDVDTYAEGGENIYKGSAKTKTGKTIHVKINQDKPFVDDDYEYWFTLPHELTHDYNYTKGGQKASLDKNQNTAPGHDSWDFEKHSDLEALRFMLYKYGIYDSRGTKDATPEDIQKLRDKYPDIRPLKQMDNEKAAWMINNVADNTTNKKKRHLDTYYA